jgi:hypothetical protein
MSSSSLTVLCGAWCCTTLCLVQVCAGRLSACDGVPYDESVRGKTWRSILRQNFSGEMGFRLFCGKARVVNVFGPVVVIHTSFLSH